MIYLNTSKSYGNNCKFEKVTVKSATPLSNNNAPRDYLPGTAAAPFFQNERLLDWSQLLLPIADI